MNIRPKHISIYQGGNTLDLDKWIKENQDYYNWFSNLYKNAQVLKGDPLKQRTDNWNKKQLSSSHHTTDNLKRSAYNNYLYTKDYDARQRDLTYWSEQQKGLNNLTDQQIVDLYNTQAQSIRDAREAPQTYNKSGYSGTNRIFRNMFYNRSMQGTNTPDYNIGYQENLDDIEGTSTWQRRMDRYQNPFEQDTQEGQQNRTFYITTPQGKQIKVYKKENGDLGLFPNSPNNPPSQTNPEDINNAVKKPGGINPTETKDKESIWSKLGAGLKNVAPDLLDAIRLAGNLHNNERVYNESMKAIIPNLQQTYYTHRQVVGDEATKQAYYRRAAQGETRAAQPFTSDADRQVAYMNEAKRIGDELRAQGDLADNQEIRRTSDESNQHQWANKQRDTELANNNLTELIKAKAARHQLTAQKYSSDWTNWDQFLLGKQAKLEQNKAKQKAIQDQLNTLSMQESLLNDTYLAELKDKADKIWNDPKATQEQKLAAAREYRKASLEKQKQLIQIYQAKSGTKLTYKNNSDKYLYKTSRDIVEHFRKMSKMTDDSRVRTLPKTVKLSSHPRKMQLGGVAPFTIYRPLGVGGESAISTQTSSSGSSSSKDNPGKDKLDMVKELFKAIQGQGLPVDVSQVYSEISGLLNRAKAFGEELSTDDIASMYLSSMQKINNLKYSKEVFDKAKTLATTNEALNEFAVTTGGKLVLQDLKSETGEIKLGTYKELIESNGRYNALTNDQLLNLRAYSPNMALMKGDEMMQIVNNGVGMNKIAAQIKSMAASLGSSTEKIEGISQVESNRVKAGLKILAGTDGTPDGYYQVTNNTKDSQANVKMALNYIYSMLPNNYKTILEVHSGGRGQELIANFLTSQTDYVEEQTISPLTGKASDKDGKDSSEKIKSNPLMQLIQGEGGVPRTWNLITKDSNVKISVDGIEYSQLPKITEDMSLDKMLSESGIAGILDSKQGITFGDQKISPDQLKDIMYSNSGGMVVTLPCKIVNGHKEVNLGVKKTYEEAIQEVESKGLSKNSPEYYKILGEVLKQKGLNSLLDSNGYPDRNKFGQFLVVEAYTTDKIKNLDTSSQYIEKVKNPDAQLEERMIKALSTDSKKSDYNLDIDYWLYGDDVYRGTVFIPLNNNLNAAINASGSQISVENARELENKFQNFNKASNMKSSNSDVL